jgi:hypothetical protein
MSTARNRFGFQPTFGGNWQLQTGIRRLAEGKINECMKLQSVQAGGRERGPATKTAIVRSEEPHEHARNQARLSAREKFRFNAEEPANVSGGPPNWGRTRREQRPLASRAAVANEMGQQVTFP